MFFLGAMLCSRCKRQISILGTGVGGGGGSSSSCFWFCWGKRGRTGCFPRALEREGEGLERAGRIAILPCVIFWGGFE